MIEWRRERPRTARRQAEGWAVPLMPRCSCGHWAGQHLYLVCFGHVGDRICPCVLFERITYEVWDLASRNLVGEYDSYEEAQEIADRGDDLMIARVLSKDLTT